MVPGVVVDCIDPGPMPRSLGVCGGIAEYFSVDPTAVRVLWVVLTIFPGAIICGVIAYLVAWFVMPTSQALATTPPASTTAQTPE